MPTYDYKCLSCDNEFTVMVAIKEKENIRCTVCGSAKISQIYSGAGIAVKSSGESGGGCGSNYGFG